MLLLYYMSDPVNWIIPWILQAIGYYRVLRKMGQKGTYAVVPFVAEGKLSSILFENMRSYWHPLIMTGVYLAASFYLRSSPTSMGKVFGILLTLLALLVYGIFLVRLYIRLCKSFHKGFFFTLGMIIIPPLFLILLGNKNEEFYGGPVFKHSKIISRPVRWAYNIFRELLFIAEMVLIVGGVGYLVISTYMPRPMVYLMLDDFKKDIKGVTGDGVIVDRETSMGEDYALLEQIPAGREKLFPDHSKDESVVVLEYFIGSNLEDNNGLATFNIDQIKDATREGSALKFVIEAGGSNRWFTSGIKDKSVGRYEITDGNVKLMDSVDSTVSMSEPEEFLAFLQWAKENYPADRYMLAFWDHGGGLSSGFGQDILNKRDDGNYGTLHVNEIIDAIDKSGMKFDLVGFDACLMQDVELAKAFEPYADYYLGSEEVESGFGWYYTSAFGMLAKDPGVSTEEFAKELISSFDVYNTVFYDGKPQGGTTLSLIDLSRIGPAFDKLSELYGKQDAAIRADARDYTDISLAARKAYIFQSKEQIDLINYLQLLDGSDYDDSICMPEELKEICNYFKAAIVYRNAVSNEGINGLAMTFPFEDISKYKYEHEQYEYLNMPAAKQFYDDYFSIMAYLNKDEYSKPLELFGIQLKGSADYTQEDWYVKGFENYVDAPAITDIPLLETENGWKLELPDTVWNIIADSQQVVYQKSDDGWRYLGHDVAGARDEEDHPMVSSDGTWIFIGNQLVCYEEEPAVTSEAGVIYKGTVKAMLNGDTKVILSIEWDPITEETGDEIEGHVTGYRLADEEASFMSKGMQEIKPGESLQFLFDYYDEDGKLIKTDVYGQVIRVTTMDTLKVEDNPLGECDLRYGITLTDVYQRTFVTDMVESHITQ